MLQTRNGHSHLFAAIALAALCWGCAKNNVQNAVPDTASDEVASTVAAKHILIMYKGSERAPARVTRSKEEAKTLIEEILAKAIQGEKFEDLAMDFSDCPSCSKGGDLGRFGRGQMAPAFEEASFACEVGGMTDIVETPFGYHIIYRYE